MRAEQHGILADILKQVSINHSFEPIFLSKYDYWSRQRTLKGKRHRDS